MNVWDWLILVVIAAAAALGVRRVRKKGASCHGACTGCAGCAGCQKRDGGC